MHALKLTVTIDSSRRVELQLPADTPEGEAEIIVLVVEDEEVKTAAKGEVKPPSSLRAYFEELDRQPLNKEYTREEMDAYLAEERASWD
jgi:hypothetical protein